MMATFRAKYGYLSEEDADVMAFSAGDLLLVSVVDQNGWSKGVHPATGVEGWFPASFAEPVRRRGRFFLIHFVVSQLTAAPP
jgi:hypothetical protein